MAPVVGCPQHPVPDPSGALRPPRLTPLAEAQSGTGDSMGAGRCTGKEGNHLPYPPWPRGLRGSVLLILTLWVPPCPQQPREDLPSTPKHQQKDLDATK